MRIWNSIIDKMMQSPRLRVEYGGCHAPHNETPLYGRNAYWRLYIDDAFIAKVTAPVKAMEPKPATLEKLLKAAVKARIENIGEVCETDHYGQIYVVKCDPSSVRRLLELVEGQYIDLPFPKAKSEAA